MRTLSALVLCILLFAVASTRQQASATVMSTSMFMSYFSALYVDAERKGKNNVLELGVKCYEAGLAQHARKCFNTILAKDSTNKIANTYLGRVKVGNKWILPSERDTEMRNENTGKQLWGANFVSKETIEELRKVEQEKLGWQFTHYFSNKDNFVMYAKCNDDNEAWSVSRLIENVLFWFDIEFGDVFGKTKNTFTINIFSSAEEMKDFATEKSGTPVNSLSFFDSKSNTAYAVLGGSGEDARDAIVDATVMGILGLYGYTGQGDGYWVYHAFRQYFVLARCAEDRITIGYHKRVNPDPLETSQRLVRNGLFLSMQSIADSKQSSFDNDPNAELRSSAWIIFHVMNHEHQGYYKKGFHSFLKLAVKGKGNFETLKKMSNYNAIAQMHQEWITMMPPGDVRL